MVLALLHVEHNSSVDKISAESVFRAIVGGGKYISGRTKTLQAVTLQVKL